MSKYGVNAVTITVVFALWIAYENLFALRLGHASPYAVVITNALGVAFVVTALFGNAVEEAVAFALLVAWGLYLNVIALPFFRR